MLNRNLKRKIRSHRLREKISGNLERPRLSLFKSNRHLYAQVIDDQVGRTLLSVSDLGTKKGKPKERAKSLGEEVAKKCLAKKIKRVVLDRGGYKYTGLVKIIADSAREKGLTI